ncbi:MAG: hypothetical protein C5S52_08670 [ANME-2 cluster archaeon]|nr:hypothetical protein [ANME-2 cluster archaeon]
MIAQMRHSPLCSDEVQPGTAKLPCNIQNRRLVFIPNREKDRALRGKPVTCGKLRLVVCGPEVVIHSHHLASGSHLRTEYRIRTRQLVKRQQDFFYRDAIRHWFIHVSEFLKRLSNDHLCSDLRKRDSHGF